MSSRPPQLLYGAAYYQEYMPSERLAEDIRLPVLDRAAHRLDAAFVDGEPWDAVRAPLAAMYAESGLSAVASLVAGPLRRA